MMDEAHLILALQAQDEQALVVVFDQYADRLYRLALSLLHDEQLAEDAVQETFIALLKSVAHFEGRSRLGTWLYRVTYNHCLAILRRERPQVDWDEMPDETIPTQMIDWRTLPESVMLDGELMQQVMLALQNLNPSLRAVFVLRDMEELSTEETAHALEISLGAVKVRLHRARLALREALAEYFAKQG